MLRTVFLHIKREQFSFGRSLNIACSKAVGDFLVFISGHCIPTDSFWLFNLVQPLRDSLVEYSYGKQIAGAHSSISEHKILHKYFPDTSRVPQLGFFCNNANSALLASTWSKYKFDEDLTGLEDMHLPALVEGGGKVGYVAGCLSSSS